MHPAKNRYRRPGQPCWHADTVAWLYAPDGPPDGHDVTARGGMVWLDGIDHTPDEAVDLARALLAAAEEARVGPAVTKDEIRYAIRGSKDEGDGAVGVYLVHEDEATDAVWALVSGSDPANPYEKTKEARDGVDR